MNGSTACYWHLIKEHIKASPETLKLLYVNFPTAEVIREISNFGIVTEGIHHSRDIVTKARRQDPSLSLSVGDLENIPYKEQEFDVVIAANSLFFHNQEKSIIEICRVLKPQGVGVLGFRTKIKKEPVVGISGSDLNHLFEILRDDDLGNLCHLIEDSCCNVLSVNRSGDEELESNLFFYHSYEIIFRKLSLHHY